MDDLGNHIQIEVLVPVEDFKLRQRIHLSVCFPMPESSYSSGLVLCSANNRTPLIQDEQYPRG